MDPILDRWWLLTLRGAAAIIFGVLTFVAPLASIFALVIVWGAYALIDGVLDLGLAIRSGRRGEHWGWFAFAGVCGIVAGLVAFFWPGITALALLFVIAAWAVATGIGAILAAVRLRKAIKGEWLLALTGLLSVALGILLVVFPGPGALAVVMWIGAWAIIAGALMVVLSLRMRSLRTRVAGPTPTGAVPTPTPTAA
jgi:uncharacterized membrane protein HdeD (DUF308 family)